MSATTEALALERLLGLANASWTTQAIGATVRHGLPTALAEGACQVDALAATTKTHAPSLVVRTSFKPGLTLPVKDGQVVTVPPPM